MATTITQNILVTGGSGFIGSNLVDLLVAQGHEVFVIDDLSSGLEKNENKSANYFHFNLMDCVQDNRKIKAILTNHNIQTVYHLAANADISLSVSHPEKAYEINLMSSIALVNTCNSCNVERFFFASTSAVYGEPHYLPVDRKHPTSPISPYGLTKLGFEQYLNYLSKTSSTKFAIFRFPNVYGFRQRPDLEGGVIAIFQYAIQLNHDITIFGDGEQTRDWVDVSDIKKALYLGLSITEKFNIFLLGSNTKTSLNKLFEYFKEVSNYSKDPTYLAPRAGDIKHMMMNYDHANKVLNWKPVISLRDGIENLIHQTI